MLDYVVGSIRRSSSRALTHLDEVNFREAYEQYRRHAEDVAVERAQALVTEHMNAEIFEGVLSQREQDHLVDDMRERKGNWLWQRPRSDAFRRFTFRRIRDFINGTRNHWLLRSAAIGAAFIFYDVAVATSTFDGGEIRSDKIIVVAKELPSIPMGLAMIASPFLPRGERQERR